MIHLFEKSRLMFPRRWANSVAAWISGITSPSGTIKIQNNLSPESGPSATFDVNLEELAKKLKPYLDEAYVRKDGLRSVTDETSIAVTNGLISVRSEYVRRIARGNA